MALPQTFTEIAEKPSSKKATVKTDKSLGSQKYRKD